MMEASSKYIELESCIFPAGVVAMLDVIGDNNQWTYEGAAARHSGTVNSNSSGYRLMSIAKTNQPNRNSLRVILNPNTSTLQLGGYNYTTFTIDSTPDFKLNFYVTNNSATLNGVTQTASTSAGSASTYRLMIGSGYTGGYGAALSVKFWYLKAWESGVLRGDYVAVRRKEDGMIGILNKVNGTFIAPSGGSLTT